MESIQSGTSRLKLQGGWSEAFRCGSKGRKMRYRPARKSDVGSVKGMSRGFNRKKVLERRIDQLASSKPEINT